jgi:catechol 2,3-dioxygenase-like lactoylglutathione lyase family enzyme
LPASTMRCTSLFDFSQTLGMDVHQGDFGIRKRREGQDVAHQAAGKAKAARTDERKLCLEWGEGDGRGAMLDMGDGAILELFAGGTGRNDEPAENKKAGRFFHLAITTDNTDAAYEAALAAGAVADRPPCDINIKGKEKELPARIAFVFGPDGEWLEFFQVL